MLPGAKVEFSAVKEPPDFSEVVRSMQMRYMSVYFDAGGSWFPWDAHGRNAGGHVHPCVSVDGIRDNNTDPRVVPAATLLLQTAVGKFCKGSECPPVAENREIDWFSFP